MKTREITVWIHRDAPLDGDSFIVILGDNISKREFLKARLIIEIPERKATISESEWDEIMQKCPIDADEKVFQYFTDKLFSSERGEG